MFTNSFLGLVAQGNIDEMDVVQKEKVVDALVIQKATGEIARQ